MAVECEGVNPQMGKAPDVVEESCETSTPPHERSLSASENVEDAVETLVWEHVIQFHHGPSRRAGARRQPWVAEAGGEC
jgi:hypothetical protein